MVDISVAMATYNGASYLREQLESLAAQTVLPCELIVTDDCSTDDTAALVQDFARNAPFPVSFARNDRMLGPGGNFFKAIAACRGSMIALCDQDDVWHPRKLEVASHRLLADGSLACLHTAKVVDRNLRPIGDLSQGISEDGKTEPLTLLPYVGMGFGMTMMFRRELAELAAPSERPQSPREPGLMGHDIWLCVVADALGSISLIAEPLISYRQHSSNSSGVRPSSLPERIKALRDVPMLRYRNRQRFNGETAAFFANLAERSPAWREQAHRASRKYADLSEALDCRLKLYDTRTLPAKLARLREYSQLAEHSRASVVKDFALGVLGLGVIRNDYW